MPGIIFLRLICCFANLQYTVAMMGYGPEDKNPVLELTYNYGVTEYDKGNGYAQVKCSHCFEISSSDFRLFLSIIHLKGSSLRKFLLYLF